MYSKYIIIIMIVRKHKTRGSLGKRLVAVLEIMSGKRMSFVCEIINSGWRDHPPLG